jgi:hypothetical protein
MKLHWPIVPEPGEPLPYVIVEDEDEFAGTSFKVNVQYDIDRRGVVLKRIGADAITATLMRAIRFDEVSRRILESLLDDPTLASGPALLGRLVAETGGTATAEELDYMRAARLSVESHMDSVREGHPRRGRSANNDAWNAQIANLYLDFHAKHGQRCIKPMAEHLDATPKKVSEWVSQARRGGWLTKGSQGRAGALPGLRLMKWNADQEEET